MTSQSSRLLLMLDFQWLYIFPVFMTSVFDKTPRRSHIRELELADLEIGVH